jgi:DNA-3-methyladenine glycosylase I
MIKNRCSWCEPHLDYQHYHDTEWGVPIYDDIKLFEALLLETFQAGLSWLTVLRKRQNFRVDFDNFDVHKIAGYKAGKIDSLCQDQGIIRNRLKIEAAINNAQGFLKIQQFYHSFAQYMWSFVDYKPIQNSYHYLDEVQAKTALSDQISLSLKNHGFKFVGSTIVYAHLQATGVVNDHLVSCFRYEEVKKLGQKGQEFGS